MKRVPKEITLKKDTITDIKKGNINPELFINKINEYVKGANYLLNNKIDNMDGLELIDSLSEVFDIYFDEKDYLRILTLKNRNHYIKYIHIRTYMYDEDDNNISYLCAATGKVRYLDGSILELSKLRKLVNSGDIQIIKEIKVKDTSRNKKREQYEEFVFDEVDINNGIIDKSSELYPYAAEVLRKETITKYVLYDLRQYIAEITHQAREIIGLRTSEDQEMASIGRQYKISYDNAINNGTLTKVEKVSVRYHQKKKSNKKDKEVRP